MYDERHVRFRGTDSRIDRATVPDVVARAVRNELDRAGARSGIPGTTPRR